MDGGPLPLADVDQFVEQDGVFSVQVDIFLYNIQRNKSVRCLSAGKIEKDC